MFLHCLCLLVITFVINAGLILDFLKVIDKNNCIKIPAHNRKDVFDDLTIAILARIQAGMTYRKISTVTGVSIGAIASIKR